MDMMPAKLISPPLVEIPSLILSVLPAALKSYAPLVVCAPLMLMVPPVRKLTELPQLYAPTFIAPVSAASPIVSELAVMCPKILLVICNPLLPVATLIAVPLVV